MTSANVQLSFATNGSEFKDSGLWTAASKSFGASDTVSLVVSVNKPEEYNLSGRLGTTKTAAVYDLSDRFDGNTSDTSDEGDHSFEKARIATNSYLDDKTEKVVIRFSTIDDYCPEDSASPSPLGPSTTPVGQETTTSLDLKYIWNKLCLEEYLDNRQDQPKFEIICHTEVSVDGQ